MRTKSALVVLMAAVVLSAVGLIRAETPAQSFAKGETLLGKGEFAAALKSFADAARADRGNQEYLQHYALVRRIVDLRNRLDGEKDSQRWEYMAKALRAFYVNERIYPELLKLDEQMHARLNTADSAAMLAETQLAMDQNAAAVKILSAIDAGKKTPTTQAFLGIALARTGKIDEAKQLAAKFDLPDDAGPSLTYAAARLHGATGDSAKTLELLKACFEKTVPSLQEAFKAHAKECSEFASMASTSDFAQVLQTKSKSPESKCSGGSSCAGCPMSGKCPKSQGKQ